MNIQALAIIGAALYGMKRAAKKDNGLGKGPGEGIGKYPKRGRNRIALEPIWQEGGTFYRMEFDFPYADTLKNVFCGLRDSTYGPVHLFHVRRGDWHRRHWNPNWEADVMVAVAAIEAVGTVLGGPIGTILATIVSAIYAIIKVFTWYDELDINFCVSKKVGTSHSAIKQAIRQTFPEVDVLIKENRLKYSRHYGSCKPKDWGSKKGRLIGMEHIENKTIEWRPWTQWAISY